MLEKYYRINEAAGISIHIANDGTEVISACGITVNDNRLEIDKKLPGLSSLEELKTNIPAKTFVALNLSGKGILQKQRERTEEIDQNNFSKILPNAVIEDFYVQNFISGSQSFVSVIRKTDADKFISRLQEMGFVPLALSLGPFPVQNIISQLNVYGEEMVFDGYTILRNEQSDWLSCNYNASASSPFALKIESESLHEKLVVPYAAAFQLALATKLEPVQAAVPAVAVEFQKVTEEKKLKVQASMVLAVFFIMLLANFFLLSWLNSSNAKLTEQVDRSAQSTNDIQETNNEIQQKEGLLKLLGWEGNINKSALIDQVASLLPRDITWRQAEIDPVDLSGSRSRRAIVFFKRKMRVTGNAEKIIPVNEWIARIKARPWAKNVQLDSYTFNSELNTGQFIITIDY